MIDLNAIKAAPEKLIEVARDLWNAERLNPQARICEALAEELIEVVPFIERLQSELTAAHEQLGYNAKPNDSQEWARISGAVAHQLIERHADDWREAGDMMEAFAASRAAARPAVVLSDEQIIEMAKQIGDLWGSSDDDWLIRFARAILAAQQAPADAGQAQALADAELPPLPASQSNGDNTTNFHGELLEYTKQDLHDYGRACMALRHPTQCAAPDERAAFEAWALREDGGNWEFDSSLNKHPDGKYIVGGVRNEWEAWQARASLAPRAPAAQPEAKAAPADAERPTDFATPRVDALKKIWEDDGATRGPAYIVMRDLAEQLEHELRNAANQAAPAVAALSDEQITRLAVDNGVIAFHEDPKLIAFASALLAAAGNSQGQAAQPEQQPVADGRAFWVLERFTDGSSAGYWDGVHSQSFTFNISNAVQFCRKEDAFRACSGWRSADDKLVEHMMLPDAAPVPAAAPEPLQGWREAIDGLMDFAPASNSAMAGMIRGGPYVRKDRVIEVLERLAAAPVGGAT